MHLACSQIALLNLSCSFFSCKPQIKGKSLNRAHSFLCLAVLCSSSFLLLSLSLSLSLFPFPLSLRNDTHANSGYPCHLPLTSCGSRDHVFSVPWDLHSYRSSGSSGNGHREARVYRQKHRPERDNNIISASPLVRKMN